MYVICDKWLTFNERDSELSKHVSADECIVAAALLERQKFWRFAKRYAVSWLPVVGCFADTHLLNMEHNLLQTGNGSEEAQQQMRTDRLTYVNLIGSYLHHPLLDHDETFCVTQMDNLGLFGKDWFWTFWIHLNFSTVYV